MSEWLGGDEYEKLAKARISLEDLEANIIQAIEIRNGFVDVADMARAFGRDKSGLIKKIKKWGLKPVLRYGRGGDQKRSMLTQGDFDKFMSMASSSGWLLNTRMGHD